MSWIEKYKTGLALVLGTLCLIVALFLPAKSALGLTSEDLPWRTSNWIFLGLGIIFLWGEIMTLAKTFQNVLKRKTE